MGSNCMTKMSLKTELKRVERKKKAATGIILNLKDDRVHLTSIKHIMRCSSYKNKKILTQTNKKKYIMRNVVNENGYNLKWRKT
jgi:hypothetical protein